MNRLDAKKEKRTARKRHIRKNLKGSPAVPRMSIFKSNKHLSVQVVDDVAGKTLAAVSTMERDLRSLKRTVAEAGKIGEAIAERLKKLNIGTIVFDRNGYRYHGIVKAVADGARKAGISF